MPEVVLEFDMSIQRQYDVELKKVIRWQAKYM